MFEGLKTEIETTIRTKVDKKFGEIDGRVWVRLLQNKRFVRSCQKAAKGDDASKTMLALAVWGASVYLNHNEKPSWQKRYEELLRSLWFQIIFQYARRQGFSHVSSSGKVIDDFDFDWHMPWMFTADVDLEAIRLKWNECHPQEAFSSVKSFKQRCGRALESMPDSYRNELLSRVICPDEKARRSALRAQKERRKLERFLAYIDLYRHLHVVSWDDTARWYNGRNATHYSGDQLRSRYYALERKAREQHWDDDPKPMFLEDIARQMRSREDYYSLLAGFVKKDEPGCP